MPLDAVPATIAPSCLIAGYVSTGREHVCNCAKVLNEMTGPLPSWVSASRRKLGARRVYATCRYAFEASPRKVCISVAEQICLDGSKHRVPQGSRPDLAIHPSQRSIPADLVVASSQER
ncbi:uncharacterized protein TrAtP1_006624 [Trichoderma atroviride]|uniref:uncharacterized protein n=1 Tax=Hypocrea atroviridis TaxID=63577 RepID=UPI00331E0803|nr:hypothetical protein TrAtP1_006624 [Trichoderma atroviride]